MRRSARLAQLGPFCKEMLDQRLADIAVIWILSPVPAFEYLMQRPAHYWRCARTVTKRLPYVRVMEDGMAHTQLGTFERRNGDTNRHQLGQQKGHRLHALGVHWPDGTHKGMS